MLKLIFIGIIVSSLSNLTGVPASPVFPSISNNRIKLELTEINQNKYKNFKKYVASKF